MDRRAPHGMAVLSVACYKKAGAMGLWRHLVEKGASPLTFPPAAPGPARC